MNRNGTYEVYVAIRDGYLLEEVKRNERDLIRSNGFRIFLRPQLRDESKASVPLPELRKIRTATATPASFIT